MDRTKWQHLTPQREPWECDPIQPKRIKGAHMLDKDGRVTMTKPVCQACGKRIRPMRKNEGPESLQSLFRF